MRARSLMALTAAPAPEIDSRAHSASPGALFPGVLEEAQEQPKPPPNRAPSLPVSARAAVVLALESAEPGGLIVLDRAYSIAATVVAPQDADAYLVRAHCPLSHLQLFDLIASLGGVSLLETCNGVPCSMARCGLVTDEWAQELHDIARMAHHRPVL